MPRRPGNLWVYVNNRGEHRVGTALREENLSPPYERGDPFGQPNVRTSFRHSLLFKRPTLWVSVPRKLWKLEPGRKRPTAETGGEVRTGQWLFSGPLKLTVVRSSRRTQVGTLFVPPSSLPISSPHSAPKRQFFPKVERECVPNPTPHTHM